MRVAGTFAVTEFTAVHQVEEIAVGHSAGHAHMVKEFAGEIEGRALTQFSYVFDDGPGGTYVATECFEGTVAGRHGTFAFVHSATDPGDGSRQQQFFLVVPGSGTDGLSGIRGGGAIEIDDDGTHHLVLDVELV